MKKDKKDTKESFCGACVMIPLALAGAGVAGVGAKKKGMYKKTRTIMLWGGISITLLSLLIAVIYISKCKDCR